MAVVKPAGLLTHPTEAKEKDSLLSRVSSWAAKAGKGRAYVGVVHRLDKETSGALVFARSRKATGEPSGSAARAHGGPPLRGGRGGEPRRRRRGRSIGRSSRRANDASGWPGTGETGIKAITDWKVLERFGIATLVEARLRTGRTHQIRIHFSHAGHPLVGDQVYRDPKKPGFPIPFKRQALHAGHLGWEKPDGGKVSVSTPPARDFEELLSELRKRKAKAGRSGKPGAPGPSKKR